jgi:hypothetical protein
MPGQHLPSRRPVPIMAGNAGLPGRGASDDPDDAPDGPDDPARSSGPGEVIDG